MEKCLSINKKLFFPNREEHTAAKPGHDANCGLEKVPGKDWDNEVVHPSGVEPETF